MAIMPTANNQTSFFIFINLCVDPSKGKLNNITGTMNFDADKGSMQKFLFSDQKLRLLLIPKLRFKADKNELVEGVQKMEEVSV
jgi:hypothetical protein